LTDQPVTSTTETRSPVPADGPWIEEFLASRGADRVARGGELVIPLDHPMLIALVDERRVGLLTYVVGGDACEIKTLHAVERWHGIGTALLDAVMDVAVATGCRALWVITTNDDTDAFRFYQRRGFRIRTVRAGAVDVARERLKPEIPRTGDHGIPIRDEIELERSIPG
jgi:GNAT superfamily N-acetyltransferase